MVDSRYHTALLDSNILASITLTDVFVQLAVDDVYRAKWTADIHREWIAAVHTFRSNIKHERLERRRRQMDAKTRDALVLGYEGLIGGLSLPDSNDRHVLAAAIVGNCDLIVTKNLKDFPSGILVSHGLSAKHPDTFLSELLDHDRLTFCESIRKVRIRATNPPFTVDEFLRKLSNEGLVETVAMLQLCTDLIC